MSAPERCSPTGPGGQQTPVQRGTGPEPPLPPPAARSARLPVVHLCGRRAQSQGRGRSHPARRLQEAEHGRRRRRRVTAARLCPLHRGGPEPTAPGASESRSAAAAPTPPAAPCVGITFGTGALSPRPPLPKPFPAPGNGLVGNTEPPLRRPTPRALSAAAPHGAGQPTRGFGVSFPLHRSSARLSLCCKNGEMGAKEKRMRLNSNLSMENPPPTPPRDEPGLQDRYHHAVNFNATASGAARSAPCPSLRESCSTVLHATPVALNVGSPPCQRCHRSLPPPDRTRASLSTSHSTQSTAGPTPCATGAGNRAKG